MIHHEVSTVYIPSKRMGEISMLYWFPQDSYTLHWLVFIILLKAFKHPPPPQKKKQCLNYSTSCDNDVHQIGNNISCQKTKQKSREGYQATWDCWNRPFSFRYLNLEDIDIKISQRRISLEQNERKNQNLIKQETSIDNDQKQAEVLRTTQKQQWNGTWPQAQGLKP